MNIRKNIIFYLLYATKSTIPRNLKEIDQLSKYSQEEIRYYIDKQMENLLIYAYKNVPYYKKLFNELKLIKEGGVDIKRFQGVPLLTKDILRDEGQNMYSYEYKERSFYKNTSGGSTGEPVKFIQDSQYDEWNKATKIYHIHTLGKEPGEKEIKFWGSDRDIIEGTLGTKENLINFLYNRKFYNTYDLTSEKLYRLVKLNNKFKPKSYWAYTDGMYEFARFILKNKVQVYSPRFIIVTINPLLPHIREVIEKAFHCPVYNQYGSREVGWIASQSREGKDLYTFPWYNFVEILGKDNKPVRIGEEGNVVVTNLRNLSMPLIRYEIGDVAVLGKSISLSCGSGALSLKSVLGRTLGYFRRKDGSLAHSHYLVQQLFFKSWIKKFQIIQEKYNLIIIRIEKVGDKKVRDEDLNDIKEKIKSFMRDKCKVEFKFVKEIKPAKSGKYLYTISKLI